MIPFKDWLLSYSLLTLALFAGLVTFFLTAVGSSGALFLNRVNPKIFSVSLGFSGGIMIAASFWSLLNPAIEVAKLHYEITFLPITLGFIIGVVLLRGIDLLIPHLHMASPTQDQEGPKIPLRKGILILLAITIHNIPEGLALGVAYGSVEESRELLISAINLTLGIGLQNIPEGLALSLTLRQTGINRTESFLLGALSAVVEPIFSLLGVGGTLIVKALLPYALSLAAGAMIFVTIEELLPEAQKYGNSDLASIGFGLGFLTMMILDTSLG